jgi:hypothetical protein
MSLFDQDKWLYMSRFELLAQSGTGLSTGQGSDPIVMARFSRDGGQTWGTELQMATGKMGEYRQRAFLNRMGRARNWVVELSSSDPTFVAWLACYADVEEGTS